MVEGLIPLLALVVDGLSDPCTETGLAISYLNYGEWLPIPSEYAAEYGLDREVMTLVELVKNKRRSRYELSVCKPGIVSVDRDLN